jgi:hypothetical protein
VACSGIHCDGCGSCGGGRAVAVVVVLGAVAALGSTVAAALADLLTIALVVLSAAVVAMVTGLAVKMRRGRRGLVQWHQEQLPAPAPVKAISGQRVGAYVIRQAEPVREPRR